VVLLTLAVELSLDSDHSSHRDLLSRCQDDFNLPIHRNIQAANSSQQPGHLLQMQDRTLGTFRSIILLKNTTLP
jgi:hypothetical protein